MEDDGVRVVVIDSLNGYLTAMTSERFLLAQLHELLAYFNAHGVLTIMTTAQHGMLNTTDTTSQEVLREVGKGQGGVGLMSMYERVKKLGGTIHIVSTKLGTTIKAQLPFMEMRESSTAAALS